MHTSLEGYLKHVEAGHIRMVVWDDLVLFNYTDQATFDKVWNEYTLNARGHIFNKDTGEVVARPFGKFFNYNEHEGIYGKEVLDGLLKKTHYIQQKADGSLGVVFWWKGEWRVATRGSFSSEQAIRGQEILKKYNMPASGDGWTYLAEIIYPENRIIVPYGDVEKLVLLAARDNSTGQYSNALETIATKFGMPLVQQ
jgi:RNA ligase